jgi:hypothetical protein
MEEQVQTFQDKPCTMQTGMRDDDEEEEKCQLRNQQLNVNAPVMMEASYTNICTRTHAHTYTHVHMAAWPSYKHIHRLFHDNVSSTMIFILNLT